jgi:chaperone required for assembly of F1-ATPase
MKRFYSAVSISDTLAILLDGKPVHTPKKAQLILPNLALAQAVAAEWARQGEQIVPQSMPLTGLSNAAIDHMATDPAPHVAALAAYGANDLLYYRATAEQADLAQEQARVWNPILDWAENFYGIEFAIVAGIAPIDQPADTVQRLHAAVAQVTPWQLAALSPLVTISGSLIVGLALLHGAFDASVLWAASCLDALWQEQHWGAVDDAVELRAYHQAAFDAAAIFLGLIADKP